MTSELERQDLDPNITLELTPDEITLVDAVQLEAYESGSFVLVRATPPPLPGRSQSEAPDHTRAPVEPPPDDVEWDDLETAPTQRGA